MQEFTHKCEGKYPVVSIILQIIVLYLTNDEKGFNCMEYVTLSWI